MGDATYDKVHEGAKRMKGIGRMQDTNEQTHTDTPAIHDKGPEHTGVVKRLVVLGLMGVILGILLDLTGGLLRIWGKNEGFSLAALGWVSVVHVIQVAKVGLAPFFSISFPPMFSRSYGQREGWFLFLLLGCIAGIGVLSFLPFFNVAFVIVLLLLLLGIIGIDLLAVVAQRENVPQSYWGLSESLCNNGTYAGITLAWATGMWLSSIDVSFPTIYRLGAALLALFFLLLIGFCFSRNTPKTSKDKKCYSSQPHLCSPTPIGFRTHVVEPLRVFLSQKRGLYVLLFMALCPVTMSLVAPMREVFLLDQGIKKIAIGIWIRPVGLWGGAFAGVGAGFLLRYTNVFTTLFVGIGWYYVAIAGVFAAVAMGIEQLTVAALIFESWAAGFLIIGFYTSQLSFCQRKHFITQIAFITTFSDLIRHGVGGLSGLLVEWLGWQWFWGAVLLPAIPIGLLLWLGKKWFPFLKSSPTQKVCHDPFLID